MWQGWSVPQFRAKTCSKFYNFGRSQRVKVTLGPAGGGSEGRAPYRGAERRVFLYISCKMLLKGNSLSEDLKRTMKPNILSGRRLSANRAIGVGPTFLRNLQPRR